MTSIKKKTKLEILSKIYINYSITLTEPSNYFALIGYREVIYSLINPIFFQKSIQTCFALLEFLIEKNYSFIFIVNLHPVLLTKFKTICAKKNYFILKDSEIFAGFLSNKKKSKRILISLFLDFSQAQLVQKEAMLMNVPLISFNDLSVNKVSSSLFIPGNFSCFSSQNLILNLLTLCFKKKNNVN